MVNSELVLELMKIFSAKPDNFPRVLNAFVRRETLALQKSAEEVCDLIESETQVSRGRYLGEHLEDLANTIRALEEFIEYFRDVPLGKSSDGKIYTGETVRRVLHEYANRLGQVRENVRRSNWKLIEKEEFDKVKGEALASALKARSNIQTLDSRIALAWTESEPEPRQGVAEENSFDFIFKDLNQP